MQNDGKDLGLIEDLFNCVSDLYSAEIHALATFALTKQEVWLEMAEMCRKDRSELLFSVAPENQGEAYCFMKHISGVARNFQEIGNRYLEKDNRKYASELFEKSETYKNLFKYIYKNFSGGKK